MKRISLEIITELKNNASASSPEAVQERQDRIQKKSCDGKNSTDSTALKSKLKGWTLGGGQARWACLQSLPGFKKGVYPIARNRYEEHIFLFRIAADMRKFNFSPWHDILPHNMQQGM